MAKKKTKVDASDFTGKLRGAVLAVSGAIEAATHAGGLVIEESAKEKAAYLTGTLRRSIGTNVTGTRTKATAYVGPAASVPYARITELGGVIVPKQAKMLAWQDRDGKWRFAKRVVRAPRPYMRPAFDEKKSDAVAAIRGTLALALGSAFKGRVR